MLMMGEGLQLDFLLRIQIFTKIYMAVDDNKHSIGIAPVIYDKERQEMLISNQVSKMTKDDATHGGCVPEMPGAEKGKEESPAG